VSARRGRPPLILQVPSRTEFLAVVLEVTRGWAGVAGFEKNDADQIALAVDEAVTNVIEHAYGGAGDKIVELRYEDRSAELRVDVIDNGLTVDPRTMPKVDLERYASERRKGGLGVHLMGRIMDSVTFRRSARRNVCCLVRRKPGVGPDSGAEQ
jgi:serine/threonine-protein kinase RsbW